MWFAVFCPHCEHARAPSLGLTDLGTELERAQDAVLKRIDTLDKKANPSVTSEDNASAALREVRAKQREVVGLHSEKIALVQQAQAIVCAHALGVAKQ
jgi:hypothetical protein